MQINGAMVERLVDQSQDLPYRPAAVVPVALAYALCFEHNHTLGPKQWGTFRRSAKSGGLQYIRVVGHPSSVATFWVRTGTGSE